jgi:hypothetical protein
MGRTDEKQVGTSSRSSRRRLTKRRLILFSILLVATIVTGAMAIFLIGSPEATSVAEVRALPEGSEAFWLEEGDFEVWHRVDSQDARVQVWGPGNHMYFSGDTRSASDGGLLRSDEYRLVGTFDGDAGKYRVYSEVEEDAVVIITDPTIVYLMTLLFGVLLFATFVYYLYIGPPKSRG